MKRHILPYWLAPLILAALLVAGAGLAVARSADLVYHGNVKSRIFHRPSCRWYFCKNCVAIFKSREAAIQAGYRPCKVCRP